MEIITEKIYFLSCFNGLLLLSEAIDPFTGSDLACLFLPSDGHVDFETEFFTLFFFWLNVIGIPNLEKRLWSSPIFSGFLSSPEYP